MHLRTINVYQKEIVLQKAFKSNGSSIQKKLTYYYLDLETKKIIEIPYSPSMGLRREELIFPHPFVGKNLSWFQSDLTQLEPPQAPTRQRIVTYGIGEEILWEDNTLVKIKCDAPGSQKLAQSTHHFPTSGQGWFVDFNQGLNESELKSFIDNSSLSTCFGIEQPMPIGTMPGSFYNLAPIILDEEMIEISSFDLNQYRPKAVVLKPWRYSFSEYLEWHHFLNERHIPYMVGSMIQSEVADKLCGELNNKASIQYEVETFALSLDKILAKAQFLGELRL